MKKLLILSLVLLGATLQAQTVNDSIVSTDPQLQLNAAQSILSGNFGKKVTIGGYSEITYNQPEGDNGVLDVQRLVLLVGYKFDDKTQFVTEIEVEHVNEIFVEQAFVNHSISDNVSLKGGLMLVPMGIVNEYHEPTTFNGVKRPAVDAVIVPSTWREIGVGVTGRFAEASLSYQAYIFNGFASTQLDGDTVTGVLVGDSGLSGGRQKGIRATVDSPTFSTKLDYYGVPGLRLGLSGYYGNTQADDNVEQLDGANISIAMVGLDARYAFKQFTARGQFIYADLKDTEAYNILTGNDLGSALQGYYVEGAYNLLPITNKRRLYAFLRYENYDTHAGVAGDLLRNDGYNKTDLTTGLSYHIAPGVVVKGDYQFKSSKSDADIDNVLNFGLGVWF